MDSERAVSMLEQDVLAAINDNAASRVAKWVTCFMDDIIVRLDVSVRNIINNRRIQDVRNVTNYVRIFFLLLFLIFWEEAYNFTL